MRTLIKILLAATTVCTGWAQGTFEAITGYSSPSGGVVEGTAGWVFRPQIGVEVTDLGIFDYVVARHGTMQVGLWTSGGSLLASGFIAATNTLGNQTRYLSISPISLAPFQDYHVGVYHSGGLLTLDVAGGAFGGSVTISPEIQLLGAANTTNLFSMVFPAAILGAADVALLGPNFRYRAIPEPSITALVALSLVGLVLHRKSSR